MSAPIVSLCAVYCDTVHCVQSGKSTSEIRVYGAPGHELKIHKIKCPWCGGIIECRLKLERVFRVSKGLGTAL